MPLELPDPTERDRAFVVAQPCRFCGTQFSGELNLCPRCGLERDAQASGGAWPAPAVPPQSPIEAQPSVWHHRPSDGLAPVAGAAPAYSPASAYGPPAAYGAAPAYGPPAAYGAAPAYGPPSAFGSAGYPPPPDALYAGYPGRPGHPSSLSPPSPPSPQRSHLIWIVAAVVAAVLVAGGVVFAVTKIGGGSNSAASVNVPDGPGVVYRSAKGHFAARFAELPDERTIPESVGHVSISIVVAADQESHTAVECEVSSEAVPADEIAETLTSAIKATAISGNITLTSDAATTFQGHPAHRGEYQTTTGLTVTALAFSYNSTRVYELLTESGTAFDNLTASFVAVP